MESSRDYMKIKITRIQMVLFWKALYKHETDRNSIKYYTKWFSCSSFDPFLYHLDFTVLCGKIKVKKCILTYYRIPNKLFHYKTPRNSPTFQPFLVQGKVLWNCVHYIEVKLHFLWPGYVFYLTTKLYQELKARIYPFLTMWLLSWIKGVTLPLVILQNYFSVYMHIFRQLLSLSFKMIHFGCTLLQNGIAIKFILRRRGKFRRYSPHVLLVVRLYPVNDSAWAIISHLCNLNVNLRSFFVQFLIDDDH